MNERNQNAVIHPKVILFDLNGTLLNLDDVRRKVNRILDSKRGFAYWMETFLHYTLVDSCTGQYHSFASIADAVTAMAAKVFDVRINSESLEEVLELMKHLPLNEGVGRGLSLLQDQGYRLAVLTNLPASIAGERMERTGLISYFEKLFNAEDVKKYKPCVETYQWAANHLGLDTKEVLMVTAHSWDICGAANAGMQTAFIERNTQSLYALTPEPDYKIRTLTDLAKSLRMATHSITGTGAV